MQSYVVQYQTLYETGTNIETILMELRKVGCSPIQSMWVICQIQQISLEDAKRTLHFSKAWADMRDEHNRFHTSLEESLLHIQQDDQTSSIDDESLPKLW